MTSSRCRRLRRPRLTRTCKSSTPRRTAVNRLEGTGYPVPFSFAGLHFAHVHARKARAAATEAIGVRAGGRHRSYRDTTSKRENDRAQKKKKEKVPAGGGLDAPLDRGPFVGLVLFVTHPPPDFDEGPRIEEH